MISDERTNSILISGNQAFRKRVLALIEKLDSPIDSGGNTRVVFLNFADAEELAAILSDGELGALSSTSSSSVNQPSQQSQNEGVDNSESGEDNSQISEPDFRPPTTTTSTQSGSSRVNIKTDPNTNSLIITAPPAELSLIHI